MRHQGLKDVYHRGSHLKVLVRQVDLQAKGVHALRQRPGQKGCQRVRALTQPGQHVLHQDDLVTHLGPLTHNRRPSDDIHMAFR